MSRAWLSKVTALCCVLAAVGAASAAGEGALVKVNGIVLRADGGFQPRTLPRDRFAPISFQGHFEVAARGNGPLVALEEAVIDFDRDGRLSVRGLPVCLPEQIAEATTVQARQTCAGALVGSGRVEAAMNVGGRAVPTSSPLAIFNGPPLEGSPTAILHVRVAVPAARTFAIVVPIERRRGPFRYRATLDLRPLADVGAITRVEAKIARRYGSGGRRSYVSARCSDGILHTHGRFTFADGTIIDGSVEKACSPA